MAFGNKGRFQAYLKDIPVFLITHDQPGLLVPVPICVKAASSSESVAMKQGAPLAPLLLVLLAVVA